jgi:cobalt-zinc-cadmium efflux system outer membrane protein
LAAPSAATDTRVFHVGSTVRSEEMSFMRSRASVVRMLSFTLFAASACVPSHRVSYETMTRDYSAIETRARAARVRDEPALALAPLDRAALIRAVLSRNPSVESAQQAWRAALARYRQAGAYEDPMVSVSFAPLSVPSSNARLGYEVGLSQRIALGGKLDAQASLAAAEAEAANSDYKDSRLRLALTASQLYDEYFLAERSLEIQARHVELVQALQQSAVAAYESGRAAALDSLQAEAELARLEYQKLVLETQRQVVVAQLNTLLHRAPDAPLASPPAELPLRDADLHPAAPAIERSIGHRPDIASAQARVRAEQARVAATESDYYPDLTLSTSYNSMWDMPEHRFMAGVALSIPLQRERRAAAVDEAAAVRAASESEVLRMTDEARADVVVSVRRVEEARQAVELYERRLLPVARDQIEAARSGFIASQNSFQVVLDAERNLRSAELDRQTARVELSKRMAALDRVLGRVPGLDGKEAEP